MILRLYWCPCRLFIFGTVIAAFVVLKQKQPAKRWLAGCRYDSLLSELAVGIEVCGLDVFEIAVGAYFEFCASVLIGDDDSFGVHLQS